MKNRFTLYIYLLISCSCHLFSQGYEIWGSGANSVGELGNNSSEGVTEFIKLTNSNEWEFLSSSEKHTLAIKYDGSLWAWGLNTNGQLGDGTKVNRYSPIQIGTDKDWVGISTGNAHSFAIKNDGSLWAWGANTVGQHGDNTLIDKFVPTRVGKDTDWKQVSCGSFHTAAIKFDNSLWVWGRNNSHQLGDSSNYDAKSPIKVTLYNNWSYVASGNEHTIALRNDGTLWAWGANTNGQLGFGHNMPALIPTQIGSDDDWVAVSSIYEHTAAIKKDGSLWQWGLNGWGQITDGTLNNVLEPYKVDENKDWSKITTGLHNTIGIKKNGSLWISGCNTSDQIGFDTSAQKITIFRKLTNYNDWNNIAIGNHFIIALRGNIPLSGNITTDKLKNEICFGDSLVLTANVKTGTPPYTYKWTPTNLISNPNIANPIAFPKTNIIFRVEVNDSKSNKRIFSLPIVVNNKSNLVINYPKIICQEDSFIANVKGGESYKWYKDAVLSSNTLSNTSQLITKPLLNSKYILEVLIDKCTFYDTLQVEVKPKLNVEIGILGNPNTCFGEYIKLFIKNKSKDVFYTWENGNNIYFSDTLIVNNNIGQYKLIGKHNDPRYCQDTAIIEIISAPIKPQVGYLGSLSLCNGDSTKLFIKDKNPKLDYVWIINNNVIIADTITTKSPIKCKLIAKNLSLSQCVDSVEIEVIEQIKEKIDINYINQLCDGDSTKLEISKPFPGVQFIWNTNETGNSIIINKAGTYWCRATNTNCLLADTIQVNSLPKPILSIKGDTTICKNNFNTLTLQGNFTSCTWSSGETTPNITISQAGIYSVIAENSLGCRTITQIDVKEVSNNIDFTKFRNIDYGKVFIGKSESNYIDIAKLNPSNIKLKHGANFSFSRNGNNLEVNFTATNKGISEDSLFIEIDKPCKEIISLQLRAEADNEKFITIKISDIQALAGDSNISIPIIYKVNDYVSLPQTLSWAAKLKYKSAIYYPEIAGDVKSANEKVEVILNGTKTFTKKEDTLTIVKGKTYLDDTIYTKIEIDSFFINSEITVAKESGSIKIIGLCMPDLRQIEFFTPTTMVIKPNPSNGEVDIEFTGEENGEIKLKLFNSAGAEVLTDSKNKKDKTITFHFDKLDLPNGIYQAQIEQSGKIVQSASLVIEK